MALSSHLVAAYDDPLSLNLNSSTEESVNQIKSPPNYLLLIKILKNFKEENNITGDVAAAVDSIVECLSMKINYGNISFSNIISNLQNALQLVEGFIKATTNTFNKKDNFDLPNMSMKYSSLLFNKHNSKIETSIGLIKHAFKLPINEPSQRIFLEIQKEIEKFYNECLLYDDVHEQHEWYWVFPRNIGDNEELKKWLAGFEKPSKSKHVDYDRGYTIDGQSYENKRQYLNALNFLLRHYDQNKREMLIEWMQAYGGQSTNSFISLLTMQGYFTHETAGTLQYDSSHDLNGPGPSIGGSAKNKKCNWSLNQNGKLELDLEIDLYELSYPNRTPETRLVFNYQTNKYEWLEIEKYEAYKKDMKMNSRSAKSLMTIKAKLEVDVIDGTIKLKFNHLSVVSYTKELLSPSRFPNPANPLESTSLAVRKTRSSIM